MAIEFTFSNLAKFMISMSPLFITSFLILGSILDQQFAKGIVYIGGVLILAVITLGIKLLFKKARPTTDEGYNTDNCQIFSLQDTNPIKMYSLPDFNSMFLAFTTAYLILPMIKNNSQVNPLLIIVLGVFIIGNGITRVRNHCNTILDIVVGNLVGTGLGVGYFFIFWATNHRDMLFIDEMTSNNVICNRPSKQTFKCAVYKNGQIIKNL